MTSPLAQEDVEHAVDLAVGQMLQAGIPSECIAAALYLKAAEMHRGVIVTPVRQ